ncbi:MAG TPA: hypothetical protein VNA24_01995 [Hyalangium sp.]|nr:hypothetical protein [Hyalangium sp.]
MRQRLLSIFGGSVGNLIEWYDFSVKRWAAHSMGISSRPAA